MDDASFVFISLDPKRIVHNGEKKTFHRELLLLTSSARSETKLVRRDYMHEDKFFKRWKDRFHVRGDEI